MKNIFNGLNFNGSQITDNQLNNSTCKQTKKIGRYLIGSRLGKGAFASVNEGLHLLTNEKVAIKIIDKSLCLKDNYIKKNLRREGNIMQRLHHSNVVQLLEIIESENNYCLIMELCSENLMNKIITKHFLTESETRGYMVQLILGVDYLHRSCVMHRDLKVENIMITKNEILKLTDFGISIQLSPSHNLSFQGKYLCKTQCGSPAYAAPEVLSKLYYNFSADIWSMGVCMFVMLTCTLPFTVKPFSIQALRDKMVNKEMNPLPDDISKACYDFLQKFLDPYSNTRITLSSALRHPWIMSSAIQNSTHQIQTIPIDYAVVKYMEERLGFMKTDIMKSLEDSSPTSAFATYNLLLKRISNCSDNHLDREKIYKSNSIKSMNQLPHLNEIPNKSMEIKNKSKTSIHHNFLIPNLMNKDESRRIQKLNNVRPLLNNRQKINSNKIKVLLDLKSNVQLNKLNLMDPASHLKDRCNYSHFSSLIHSDKANNLFSPLSQPLNFNKQPESGCKNIIKDEIRRMYQSKLKINAPIGYTNYSEIYDIAKRRFGRSS